MAMAVSSFALAAASTGAGLYSQEQQAKQQKKYQDAQADANTKAMKANAESASRAQTEENYQQNLRISQEGAAASQEMQDIQEERMEAMGTALASGGSVTDALMKDFYRQEARYKDSVKHNFDMTTLQIEGQKEASHAKAVDRTNSIQPYIPSPIAKPDYIGAALKIGQAGVNSYGFYKQNTPKAQGGWA